MKDKISSQPCDVHLQSISLTEKIFKGAKDLKIDDKVEVKLIVKITGVSRRTYSEGKPIEAQGDIVSGSIGDNETMADIESAENMKDLDKAGKALKGD